MKTVLFLIALMPNGTERAFDVPEPFLKAPTCEENRALLEHDPLVSSYASAFGAAVRFECRVTPESTVTAPCDKPRPALTGPIRLAPGETPPTVFVGPVKPNARQ